MGSGKVSSAVAGASASLGAVCCMCGDRGLLPELFRCSACSVRSQHTCCLSHQYQYHYAAKSGGICFRRFQKENQRKTSTVSMGSQLQLLAILTADRCSSSLMLTSYRGTSQLISGSFYSDF